MVGGKKKKGAKGLNAGAKKEVLHGHDTMWTSSQTNNVHFPQKNGGRYPVETIPHKIAFVEPYRMYRCNAYIPTSSTEYLVPH